MAGSTGQIPGDVIDAIRPDLEAFASLWSALRTNYQGTNITKTVARLLHMYQPEDGVLAYERLLRTLYVLLEDFDGDGLRLLVSMVPPPKGVADEVIKRVFHKATGFVRLNAPIFHRNNTNPESEEKGESSRTIDGNLDSRTNVTSSGNSRLQTVVKNAENPPEGTTILQAIVKNSSDPPAKSKSPKVRPRESEVFRGFPSNEMTNPQCRARSATHFYGPSMSYPGFSSGQRFVDYREAQGPSSGSIPTRPIDPSAYRFKWLEAPNLPRKIGYDGPAGYPDLILKTADNKFIRLPITKINGPPIGGYGPTYNPMKSAYQTFYPNSQVHPRPENFYSDPNVELSRKMTSHLRSRRRFEGSMEKSEDSQAESSTHSRVDLVDHDYGFSRSQEFSADKETFRADDPDWPSDETMERFRDTVKNTQRAIQEDIYRMDVVRCDEIVEQTNPEEFSLDPEILTVSEELKKGASDFLKRAEDEKSLASSGFPNTRILQNPENVKSSPGTRQLEGPSGHQKNVEKTNLDSSENCDKDRNDVNPVSSMKNSTLVDRNAGGKISKVGKNPMASKCQENATPSPARIFADPSTIRTGEMMSSHQANSMSEFVNYRKQYYDALLSIQRAKVAVANSLAISSTQNSTSYDPRVFQYLQQQHQLLQHQQQRLLMGPQHPVTRQMVHPAYANARGLWIRGSSDWKYSPCGQYAFPPQTYPMTTPSCPVQPAPINPSIDSSLPENIPRASHHLHRASRPATKRRKLEDIVDKLRDTDDSQMN